MSSLAFEMQNLIKRLEKRGWSSKEIEKAVGIIQNAKQNKNKANLFLEKRIYLVLFAIILASNFAISIALIPLLIALNGMILYFLIMVLGIIFGLLFELVIRSMEHLEKRHHITLAFLIPTTALINIFIISRLSNNLMEKLNLKNIHTPIIIALVYAVSFVLPYIIYRFVLKIEYYAKE